MRGRPTPSEAAGAVRVAVGLGVAAVVAPVHRVLVRVLVGVWRRTFFG